MSGDRTPLAVRLSGVRFRYRPGAEPALDGVELRVAGGEVLALVGPNGAGKSTLLRVIAGELVPEAGEVTLPGRRGRGGRLDVGYAPDEGAHFERLSGSRNVEFFARAAGLSRHEASTVAREQLAELGLAGQADRPVSDYSFGQRRKLLLVAALAHRPGLLLLDEPTAGLDADARDALARTLRARSREGSTVVLASHDLGLLPDLADRIAFVHRGVVVAGGRPHELLEGLGDATRIEVSLDSPAPELPHDLGDGARIVDAGDPLLIESPRGQAALPAITSALLGAGAHIRSVVVHDAGLEEAFRRATGQELGR